MTDTTSDTTANITESLRGITLTRLMLYGNSIPIETLLPQSHASQGLVSAETQTRLALLDSMHGQAITYLNDAESALLIATDPMLATAGDVLNQTKALLTTMINVSVPSDDAPPYDFEGIWKDFLEATHQIDADSLDKRSSLFSRFLSLAITQHLAWCLDVVLLAHHKLCDPEYDAIAEHADNEDSWKSVLSYDAMPVLHQGAHGIVMALIDLKHSLRPTKHHKQAALLKEIKQFVDLIVKRSRKIPGFIFPDGEGGYRFYGTDPRFGEDESNPDWLENHVTSCVDMIFKLDKLKASGRTPKTSETRLDAVVTSLQTWVAAAEKHQASDKAAT